MTPKTGFHATKSLTLTLFLSLYNCSKGYTVPAESVAQSVGASGISSKFVKSLCSSTSSS